MALDSTTLAAAELLRGPAEDDAETASVQYGVDLPSAFRCARLDPELLHWLQEALDGTEDELAAKGFVRETKAISSCSGVLGHVSHYARFSATFENLRDGPAAFTALGAFLESFRRLNADWITRALEATPLAGLESNVFADVTAQVHHGAGVEGKDLAWHIDSAHSVLHMSITLLGSRCLLMERSAAPGGDLQRSRWLQEPGSLYITQPCAFDHAVEFPTLTWDDRSLALHCRFRGLSLEHGEAWPETVAKVADGLESATLRVPTRAEVQRVLDEPCGPTGS